MAQLTVPPLGFDSLSPDEKLEYVQALWSRIAERPQDVPVPEWHREVVAQRLDLYRRGDGVSRSWSDVHEDLLTRLRNAR